MSSYLNSLGPGFPRPTSKSIILLFFFRLAFFLLLVFYPHQVLFLLSSFLGASPSLAGAFSPPSAVAVAASPSAPSAVSAPSAGFSGSLITVGAATVAITKSLSVIVGVVPFLTISRKIF